MTTTTTPLRLRTAFAALTFCALATRALAEAAPAPTPVPTPASTGERLLQSATKDNFTQTDDLFITFLAASAEDPNIDELAVKAREQDSPRTDLHQGAGSGAGGTVSITDKPGIADLLNLAVEHGAVTKTTNDTRVTFQTTPYLIYSHFGGKDDATHWDNLVALRHLGLSATFTADTTDNAGGLGNFQSAEAKYVALGSRSARDSAFRQHIREKLADLFTQERAALAASNRPPSLSPQAQAEYDKALIDFNVWQKATPKPIPEDTVLATLRTLLGRVRDKLTAADKKELGTIAQRIIAEEQTRRALATAISTEATTWLPAGPQLSLVYGFNRDPATVDYSRAKLLFAYESGQKVSANVNAEVALNHATNATTLHRVRSYSGEAALTLGRFAKNAVDLTAAAKVMREEATARTTTALQAKVNLYFLPSITVPLALTYANRTENSSHSQLRLNVGLAINADALLGIARKGAL